MKSGRTTIEKNEITDNLTHNILISRDEEYVFLNVNYLDGRFVIEKSFRNNHADLEKMNSKIKDFDTEEKVIAYLGLKEKKDG